MIKVALFALIPAFFSSKVPKMGGESEETSDSTENQGLLELAAGLVGNDSPFGQMLNGRDSSTSDQAMAMSMNQIGSNYIEFRELVN